MLVHDGKSQQGYMVIKDLTARMLLAQIHILERSLWWAWRMTLKWRVGREETVGKEPGEWPLEDPNLPQDQHSKHL